MFWKVLFVASITAIALGTTLPFTQLIFVLLISLVILTILLFVTSVMLLIALTIG